MEKHCIFFIFTFFCFSCSENYKPIYDSEIEVLDFFNKETKEKERMYNKIEEDNEFKKDSIKIRKMAEQ